MCTYHIHLLMLYRRGFVSEYPVSKSKDKQNQCMLMIRIRSSYMVYQHTLIQEILIYLGGVILPQ